MAVEADDVLEAIQVHTKAVNDRFAKLDPQIQKLKDSLASEQKLREDLERKLNKAAVSGPGKDDVAAHKAADNELIHKYFSTRDTKSLEVNGSKAMNVGSDADGGHTVLPYFSNAITQIIREENPLRRLARVVSIDKSDAFEEIEDINDLDATWVGETSARPETSTPQIGKLRIPTHEIYAAPKVTQQLIDDSTFDIAAWLGEKIGSRFARSELAAFTNGDGVARPRGFTTYPTAATADATRPWGTIEHVVTGANGAFHTTQGDPLIDVVHALKSGYRTGASWLMTRQVSAAIRKFKTTTTSEYIWQPGLQAGQPDMLLGYPVDFCEDLPALATNSLSCWFGNWKKAYTIVDRVVYRLLQDPYTAKPYVILYAYRRIGGQVTNFEALKAVRFST